MTGSRDSRPVFSRLVDVDRIPDAGLETTIEATIPECAAVAAEIGLPAIGALAARYTIARQPGDRFKVEGAVTARITQICTISLDSFESEIEDSLDVIFAPVAPALSDRQITRSHITRSHMARSRRSGIGATERPLALPPVSVAEGEEDPPDPIVDGRIELGALAVEFLTLALDFYPRKPGVQFRDVVVGETDAPKPSAFAGLERLKDHS